MRGLPERPEAAQGPALDPARIAGFQLYLHRLAEPRTLKLHRVALLPAATETPLPIVDAFGQYAHATWPGKLAADADLLGRRDLEEAALLDSARPKDFDRYGGWEDEYGNYYNENGDPDEPPSSSDSHSHSDYSHS